LYQDKEMKKKEIYFIGVISLLDTFRSTSPTDKEMKKKDNYFFGAKNLNNLLVAKVPKVTCDISKSKKPFPDFSFSYLGAVRIHRQQTKK
jgi:hypothetical protein